MFIILAKRRLRWLGHAARIKDGRIPKDMLSCEVTTGSRPALRPTLRYNDVCKRDLRAGDIAPTDFEGLAAERNVWRLTSKPAAFKIEQKLKEHHETKRQRIRVRVESQCGFRAKRSTIDMIISLRQLQEKCPEQRLPLYNAFIDPTIAFDLVSRLALFKLLQRIGCPPKLLKFITSLHEEMQGTVQFEVSSSEPFSIKSGVKQGCVLASTLFGILFLLLLGFAFKENEEGVYIHTRSYGRLFNFSRHDAKTKVRKVLIREMLFAEDDALTAHTEAGLQDLINCFSDACNEFGVTISIKKTNVLGQNVSPAPSISIGDSSLDVVEEFTYLSSVISSSHNLSRRVWENTKLTTNAKIAVYQACVLSTLMYGSGC